MSTPARTLHAGHELTIYQVAELKPMWLAAWAAGIDGVDVSQVTDIDASGVQLLVALNQMARREGRTLSFSEPSAPLREARAGLGAEAVRGAPAGEEMDHA